MSIRAYTIFSAALAQWNRFINRDMPWQGEKDPYLIWLSEIILQQTRVSQGLPYFLKFKIKYPTICDLARANDNEVFRLWQGLGYYSRCRNLLHTARVICDEYDGIFPDSYEELIQLKGIGNYTAAAISSFAFNGRFAVVDGNVKRVIARYFGIEEAVDSPPGVKSISEITQLSLEAHGNPGEYNQAIMNFGALVCTPKDPKCQECPLNENCYALLNNAVASLPFKTRRVKRKNRFFHYLHIQTEDYILIEQRRSKDIWQHLYQLPLLEDDNFLSEADLVHKSDLLREQGIKRGESLNFYGPYKQILTHQRINAVFINIYLEEQIDLSEKGYLWVTKDSLGKYAFPKVILDFFNSDSQHVLPL